VLDHSIGGTLAREAQSYGSGNPENRSDYNRAATNKQTPMP